MSPLLLQTGPSCGLRVLTGQGGSCRKNPPVRPKPHPVTSFNLMSKRRQGGRWSSTQMFGGHGSVRSRGQPSLSAPGGHSYPVCLHDEMLVPRVHGRPGQARTDWSFALLSWEPPRPGSWPRSAPERPAGPSSSWPAWPSSEWKPEGPQQRSVPSCLGGPASAPLPWLSSLLQQDQGRCTHPWCPGPPPLTPPAHRGPRPCGHPWVLGQDTSSA